MKQKHSESVASTPTVFKQTSYEFEQTIMIENESTFDIMLASLAPELFMLWQSMKLYKINPDIIPTIIKAIGDIAYSSGLGEVIVEIRPDQHTGQPVVKRIRSIDTRHMDIQALQDDVSSDT